MSGGLYTRNYRIPPIVTRITHNPTIQTVMIDNSMNWDSNHRQFNNNKKQTKKRKKKKRRKRAMIKYFINRNRNDRLLHQSRQQWVKNPPIKPLRFDKSNISTSNDRKYYQQFYQVKEDWPTKTPIKTLINKCNQSSNDRQIPSTKQ